MNTEYAGTPDYKRMFEQAAEERDCAIGHNKALGKELVLSNKECSRLRKALNKAEDLGRGRGYVR